MTLATAIINTFNCRKVAHWLEGVKPHSPLLESSSDFPDFRCWGESAPQWASGVLWASIWGPSFMWASIGHAGGV